MTTAPARRDHHRLEAAEGYLLLGMSEPALREVDAIRNSGLDGARICQLRAECLRELQRHDEALREFEQADEWEPDDLVTLMGLAWCLKRVDRLDDAIEAMQRAYRAHPDEPVVLYNIACYMTLAGDKPQALSWLGRALRMEPKLRQLIAAESDFDSLRDDADFQFIVTDPRDKCDAP